MQQAVCQSRARGREDCPWMKTRHEMAHCLSPQIINSTLEISHTTAKELDHFLSHLRDLHFRARHRRKIPLMAECANDLRLIINIIAIVHKGISINAIVYSQPTHIYRSDSCPTGMGGYSDRGFAWRYYIPAGLQFWATNNLLKHLAAIITPWTDIIANCLKPGDCALSMMDSMTSEGWLRKTNSSKLGDNLIKATVQLEVARMHTKSYMALGIWDYSQWFPGNDNIVADTLSRNNDRLDEDLALIFRSHCPSQIPNHFEILPMPNKIISWLTALLHRLPEKPHLFEKHTRTKLGRGTNGQATTSGSALPTLSSTASPSMHESSYLEPLPWLCGKQDFHKNFMLNWLTAQSKVPSATYVRPSASTGDPTRPWMTTAELAFFYNGCSEYSKKGTPTRNTI
jgi:hypothetical protein